MSQDLLQEWTGSTGFTKSWRVLSEQTQPLAEDDFSPDVRVTSLAFDPMRSKASGGTSKIEKIGAKMCG